MSDIKPPLVNDLGFHPAPGYMLVEVHIPDNVGKVVLPNQVKDTRRPDLERIYVLEDNRFGKDSPLRLDCGTRVLVAAGPLLNLVPNRNTALVKAEDFLGVFDI